MSGLRRKICKFLWPAGEVLSFFGLRPFGAKTRGVLGKLGLIEMAWRFVEVESSQGVYYCQGHRYQEGLPDV